MYPSFDSIKWFYDINCYTNEDIAVYVQLGCLTIEQYQAITGLDYPEQPQAQACGFNFIESGWHVECGWNKRY